MPGGERIVHIIGLPGPTADALVDQSLYAGHGRGTGRGAPHAGDDNRSGRGQVCAGAVAGAGADGIKAVVIAIGGKQGEVGKVACVIGGNAGSGLPGRLGVARCDAAGIERGAAGSSTASHDHFAGLVGRIATVIHIEAEKVVPCLLGDGLLERDGGRVRGSGGPVGTQLRADGRGRAGVLAVIEIGAADGDVVRRGGDAVDR